MRSSLRGALIGGIAGGIIGIVYLFYNMIVCRVACSSIINKLSEFYILLPFVIPIITFLAGYLIGWTFSKDKKILSFFLIISILFILNLNLAISLEDNSSSTLVLNFSSTKFGPIDSLNKDARINGLTNPNSEASSSKRLDILNESGKVVFTTNIPPTNELINLNLQPGKYKILKVGGNEFSEENISIKSGEQVIVPMYAPAVEGYILDAPSYIISSQTNLPILTIADDDAELYPDINNIWVYDANNEDSFVTYTGWASPQVIDSTNTPFFYLFNVNKNSFVKIGDKIKIKVMFELSAWWLPNNWEGPIEIEVRNTDLPKINNWYCGDTHYHSSYTNTKSTQWLFAELGAPIGATTKSLNALGLDWVTVTDHSNSFNIPFNNFANFEQECDGEAKCLVGEEVNCRTPISGGLLGNSLPGNHYLTYGLDSPLLDDGQNNVPYCNERVNYINSIGKFGYAAHPESSMDVLWQGIISTWQDYSLPFTGLEVWNKEISTDLDNGLNKWKDILLGRNGLQPRKVFISAGSDAHGDLNTVFGKEYTCVYAPSYSKQNIFTGLRNGNSYISNNGALIFSIGSAKLGETTTAQINSQVALNINYNLENGCYIRAYRGVIGSSSETQIGSTQWKSGTGSLTFYDTISANSYYRAECVNSDGSKRIYTNPIWVNVKTGGNDPLGSYLCIPHPDHGYTFYYINNVTLNGATIDVSGNLVPWTIYTDPLTSLQKGMNYTLFIDTFAFAINTVHTKAWIDFNNDKIVTQNEELDFGNARFEGHHIFNKTFTVPNSASSGGVTMRTALKLYLGNDLSPPSFCESANFSHTVDFVLNLMDCTPNLIKITFLDWQNLSCLPNDRMNRSITLLQYDLNNCPGSQNQTFIEYNTNQTCNYCSPNPINTTWTDWQNQTLCSNGIQTQNRSRTEYDANYSTCYAITQLPSDLFVNTTHWEFRNINCSSTCAPNLTNTPWSNWQNISCLNNKMNQSRFRIQYDTNNCPESQNQTIVEYRNTENCQIPPPPNPVLTLSSPKNGIYNTTRINLGISSNNKLLAKLEYIDNSDTKPKWTSLCTNCNSYNKIKSFSEGQHDLVFRGILAEGGNATNQTSFLIDSKVPQIITTKPASVSFTNGNNFYIKYSEDNCKSLSLNVFSSHGGEIALTVPCNSGKNIERTLSQDISSFDGQEAGYQFIITDIANNTKTSKLTKIKVDTAAPKITNFNVSVFGKYAYFNMTINETNFDSVSYRDNAVLSSKWTTLCSSLNDNVCYKKVNFKTGQHNLTISVTDDAGNSVKTNSFFTII
jgi:hypothetical protein